MKQKIITRDLGMIAYKEAWDLQTEIFEGIVSHKMNNRDLPANERPPSPHHFLLCEHPPVFTLGKSGKDNNLLVNEKFLESKGITFFRINRGG